MKNSPYAELVAGAMERPPLSQGLLFAGGVVEMPLMVLDEAVPRWAGAGEPCVHFCEVALGAEASRRGYATGERMGASGRMAWPDTTGGLPKSWYAAHPETWAAMTEEQRQCFVLKTLDGKGVAS